MKKGIIAIVIVALIAVAGFGYYKGWFSGSPESFKGATLTVPGTKDITVVLDTTSPSSTNNYPMGEYNDGDAERGTVVVLEDKAEKMSDGRTVAPFAHNSGGSGEFLYLGLFDAKLKHLSSFPIGDRIDITSIDVSGITITINYMIHGEGQAMYEDPNTPATLTLDVVGEKLVKRIVN
ncbi:hypothetical protein GW943_00595 [Candidatus Parcubacteria bacterium]|uniref:Uncharacterized protein n=1 Tax=Candidatus Kaiserbacteria bacterium CG10_big_fil_rev_8_21_14_0_10_47_16 TaxID=1974608 RepID=A0A2H0UDB3_9BACT|nr:hypothetical protein [Candidatus Parcubacteria bacterium]PIR84340.1 MAG: hypothetical protein COU16_01975 [Candidatus Kaiserbacteria bacterium CG10_big_fil_rev_8_21_14_0_10_47_16]